MHIHAQVRLYVENWGARWVESSMLSTNISETLSENLSQILSQQLPKQETLTKRVRKWKHWKSWLKYALLESKHSRIWAKGRATAMVMTARPVMYYDGDLQLLASSSSCLQVAINHKNSTPQNLWKRVWGRLRRFKNRLRRGVRARIPVQIDFGSILDLILGPILRSKSSSDGTRSRVQRNICFQDRFRSDVDFGAPERS